MKSRRGGNASKDSDSSSCGFDSGFPKTSEGVNVSKGWVDTEGLLTMS